MFQHWIGLHFVSNLQEQKRNTEHHKQVTKELAQLKNNTGLIANVMINFSRENAFITLPWGRTVNFDVEADPTTPSNSIRSPPVDLIIQL